MSSKVWVAAARRVSVVLAAALVAAACGSGGSSDTVIGKASGGHLTIAIAEDQPGSSLKGLNGDYSGFDIDVAQFVAKELGVDSSGITWRSTVSADRETVLENGSADMVVAAYTITDKRKKGGRLRRPVLRGRPGPVGAPERQLDHRARVAERQEALLGRRLHLRPGGEGQVRAADQAGRVRRYSDCVTALLANIVDAVTTDDVILAGYASQNPELLKVVGKPFTKDSYGIGVRKGDTAAVRRWTPRCRR